MKKEFYVSFIIIYSVVRRRKSKRNNAYKSKSYWFLWEREKNHKKGKWCCTSNIEKYNKIKYFSISRDIPYFHPSLWSALSKAVVSLFRGKLLYWIKKGHKDRNFYEDKQSDLNGHFLWRFIWLCMLSKSQDEFCYLKSAFYYLFLCFSSSLAYLWAFTYELL